MARKNDKSCFFQDYEECFGPSKIQQTSMQRITNASKKRNDGLVEKMLQNYENEIWIPSSVQVHKSCIDSYTSTVNINAYKRKHESKVGDEEPTYTKKLRGGCLFDFQKHCLFCQEITDCVLPNEYDSKIPKERRIPAYLVRTTFKLKKRRL